MKTWMQALAALMLVFCPMAAFAADATLIPIDHLVSDVAYDAHRGLIYMSDGNSILRYDVNAAAYLTPIVVAGGPLNGIDLSPDGHTLAAADADTIAVKVHLIDLDSLADTVRSDAPAFYEGGAHEVAYTRDGNLLVTTDFRGSGWTPLRKLDVATGLFADLTANSFLGLRGSSSLSTSGDGRIVGFAEGDASDGPWGFYNARTETLARDSFGTSTYNSSIATNADGSRFTLNGYAIYSADNQGLISIHDGTLYPAVSVDDPVSPTGYFAFDGSNLVGVYDLTSFARLATYDFGTQFNRPLYYNDGPQVLRISRDGSMLLARFPDGVRYLRLYDALGADDISSSATGQRVDIQLQGHIGNDGSLTYDVGAQPTHGRVFVEGDVATYVPAPGFSGQDTFYYRTHYGQAWAAAKVTVDVTADASAHDPLISFGTLPVLQSTTPIPGSKRVPGDFDGDGVSDLLWFNPQASQLGYWTMTPATAATLADPSVRRTGAKTFNIAAGYFVGAVGDFDGDGYADLMFTSSNHDLWLWTNGRARNFQSTQSYSYPADWQLVGAGDVDGNGKDDLLWLNPSRCQFAYWLMDGATRKGSRVFDIACGYYPVGVGYYTPTNRISVLWSSAANDLYVWDSRGTGFVSYDLGSELDSQGYPAFDLASTWTLGGGYAGKGIGLEWYNHGAGGSLSLDRTFNSAGIQTGFSSTQQWGGGLWTDNTQSAGYLIKGGASPASGLYALDPNAMTIQTGGLPTGDAETSGAAPRTLNTEWPYPAGWYPVGAPGTKAIPLPWR